MGLSRSTFYDPAATTLDAGETLTRIGAICDEFESTATVAWEPHCATRASW